MIATRQQLKQYCLRSLGAPVVEINVDDDQLEDRLDEALDYWRLYHHEGIEKVYLKQQIRTSSVFITTPVADTFPLGIYFKGETSGARAVVAFQTDKRSTGNEILCRNITGEFTAGETITTESGSPISAVLSDTNPVIKRELDNQYIDLPDYVYGVSRILPFAGTQTSKSMFDVQYQLRLNDLYDLTSTSIIYYKQVMSHLSLLDFELNGKPMFDFNRLQGRIYPRINWHSDVIPGDYIVLEAYRAMDPNVFTRVWSEPWLKHYVTALFKRQWGQNLSKFSGLQLPGGVSLDGQAMYDNAMAEIKDLEDELVLKSAPLEFYLG